MKDSIVRVDISGFGFVLVTPEDFDEVMSWYSGPAYKTLDSLKSSLKDKCSFDGWDDYSRYVTTRIEAYAILAELHGKDL